MAVIFPNLYFSMIRRSGRTQTMALNADGLSRRRFVQITGATATATGLAGCGGDGGNGNGNGGNGGSDQALNLMHAFTGGDGAVAAEAMFDAFREEHPDIELDLEPIGGGGNQNLDTVVANRLNNNDPPGAFANWPGKNLTKYEGALGEVDDVWEENDFEDVHIDEAVELHQQNGAYRATPKASHRLNNLFYNIEVVEEAGVDPSGIDSLDALVDALDAVATETDKTPMTQAMSGTWTVTQLWAAVMQGEEGAQAYMDFIEGNGSEAAVSSAFERMGEILENYIGNDAASLDLTASNSNIIDGNAAFIHQGNWAAGAFRNADDFEYEEDWGAVAFPGTSNMYCLHFNSWLYPANNPTPDLSKTFLAFVGKPAAQIAYGKNKGAIPTRTDVDIGEFGPYLQDVYEDFNNVDHRPPSLQHGLAVTSEKMSALNDAISNNFMGPFDVDAATQGFMDAV